MTETGWHWRTSCAINRCLGGQRGMPLCARAWANGWTCFIEAMSHAFKDPCHCESIFIRWQALHSYNPPPITGMTGPRPGC